MCLPLLIVMASVIDQAQRETLFLFWPKLKPPLPPAPPTDSESIEQKE